MLIQLLEELRVAPRAALCSGILLLLGVAAGLAADEKPQQEKSQINTGTPAQGVAASTSTAGRAAYETAAFCASLQGVFTKYYPKVKYSTKEGTVIFDHDTQIFMIRVRLKNGEFRGSRPERGPKEGGIYCEIVPQTGVYRGAAVPNQKFNRHDFTVLLLAPYSKRLDRHLHVRLFYPPDTSNEFLREFTAAVNKFSNYRSRIFL